MNRLETSALSIGQMGSSKALMKLKESLERIRAGRYKL